MFALIRHSAHAVYPDHLTSEGEEMALSLAQRLASLRGWTHIYASSRLRARETATIIGRVLDLPVELDDSLLETADHTAWMPSISLPDGIILVTHIPVIREIGGAWAKSFGLGSLPSVGVAEGLIVDLRVFTIKKIK